MNVEREDSDCSETEEDGSGTMTTDKFGNSITKKAASGNLAVQKQRAEAKVRREAKAAAAAEAKASKEAERAIMKASKKEGGGGGEQTTEEKIEALRLKMESGAKVSNKDKKVYKKLLEKKERDDDFGTLPEIDALANFSLTVTGTGSQALDGTDDTSSSNSNARQKDVVFKGVSISAPSKPLIVNADVKLIAGRRYGLIGANGRGKSTLLKFLALRKLPHNVDALLVEQESSVAGVKANATVLEQIIGADEETSRLKRREIGLEAQLASTDDDRELEAISSELSEVGSALEAAGFNTAEARARKILSGLGFDDVAIDSPVTLLSGGWQVRAALAASFLVAPSLLLLDEPTNHLDLDAVLWLEDFLGCSQGDDGGDQVGMAQPFRTDGITLVVSHDREFLDATCTDLILLTEDGDLEYHRGGLARLDQGKERRSAKRKKDYALQQKTLGEIKSKHSALSVDKIEKKVMEKLGVVRLCEKPRDYKVNFDFKSPEDGEDGSVGLRDVDFTYEGGGGGGGGDKKDGVSTFSGFKNLNFTFTKGLRACIVGANGTGKSTFLKLLAGRLEPTKGERSVGARTRIGFYDQHFTELLGDTVSGRKRLSAVDVLMGRYPSLLKGPQEARKILGQFGLDSERHIMAVDDLSGGQKARVVLASLSLKAPHLLILDEPTNHLDIESIDALIEGLEAYKGGVLAVSHDGGLVEALSYDRESGCEQPLYVCEKNGKDSSTTIRVERGGFKKYRLDLQRKQAKREAAFVALAKARKEARERRNIR